MKGAVQSAPFKERLASALIGEKIRGKCKKSMPGMI